MNRLALAAALSAALLAPAAFAQVTVKDPWVRATVPQQKSSGAFMKLSSASDARLLEVHSKVAGIVEIHEMTMEGNVMKMHAIDGIDLPTGQTVELRPGSYHVMLMDLKQQLKDGDAVALTLVVEGKDKKRQTIEVKAPVRALNATGTAR